MEVAVQMEVVHAVVLAVGNAVDDHDSLGADEQAREGKAADLGLMAMGIGIAVVESCSGDCNAPSVAEGHIGWWFAN